MHATEFDGSAPGKLVPIPEGPAGTLAFVPAALPRQITLAAPTIALLGRAENALGRLQGSVGRMVNPYLIARPLLRREAILSSRMEGTKTTAAKLVTVEAQQGSPDAATREVANCVTAMNHGLALLASMPLCLRLIRELHEKLLSDVRGAEETPGEFRRIQNFIGHAEIGSARFVPPPPAELAPLLDDLERFLNEPDEAASMPLLVRLALSHYQFETIHPFRDGNGRVGRLLLPLALQVHERLSSPVLYLSSFFEQHRRRYVDLMLAVSQRGDFESWIQFFLEAVRSSALDSVEQAARLLEMRDRYHALLHRTRSSALTLKLVDKLFELPLVTAAIVERQLDVSPSTAIKHIESLVAAKILVEITGRRRDRQYLAPELLSLLGTDEDA
jgi:Fic family protein